MALSRAGASAGTSMVIQLQGCRCLLAVHCLSRYTFVRYDVPSLQWKDLPGLFREGLLESLTAAGFSTGPGGGISAPGGPHRAHSHPTAAGRWPSSTGPGRMCWSWTCAWMSAGRPSLCWTTPSTPAPAGARALRGWGRDWSGWPPYYAIGRQRYETRTSTNWRDSRPVIWSARGAGLSGPPRPDGPEGGGGGLRPGGLPQGTPGAVHRPARPRGAPGERGRAGSLDGCA